MNVFMLLIYFSVAWFLAFWQYLAIEVWDSAGDACRHWEIYVDNKYALDKLSALCDVLQAFHVMTVEHIQINYHRHLT